MRRTELVEGVKTVLGALERNNVPKALEAVMGRDSPQEKDQRGNADILIALNGYAIDASKFGETERKIVSLLRIEGLTDARRWMAYAERHPMTHELWIMITQAVRFMPTFIELIEQDYVETMKHDPSKAPAAFQGKALLSVIIIEEKDKYSNPQRVIETLEAVQLLYESVAILNEQKNEQQMVLLACDSGSDKSFDLLGVAKLVASVKEIILSLWDRVVFFREQKMGAKLELVANSLPIIEKISEMEKAGHLEPEQAEILRRNISLGAQKFINAGATIPEIEGHSHYNPRQLMSPEPKLLAMPTTAVAQAEAARPLAAPQKLGEADDMSPDERAELERFFKQMKRKKKQKPSSQPPEAAEGS